MSSQQVRRLSPDNLLFLLLVLPFALRSTSTQQPSTGVLNGHEVDLHGQTGVSRLRLTIGLEMMREGSVVG